MVPATPREESTEVTPTTLLLLAAFASAAAGCADKGDTAFTDTAEDTAPTELASCGEIYPAKQDGADLNVEMLTNQGGKTAFVQAKDNHDAYDLLEYGQGAPVFVMSEDNTEQERCFSEGPTVLTLDGFAFSVASLPTEHSVFSIYVGVSQAWGLRDALRPYYTDDMYDDSYSTYYDDVVLCLPYNENGEGERSILSVTTEVSGEAVRLDQHPSDQNNKCGYLLAVRN